MEQQNAPGLTDLILGLRRRKGLVAAIAGLGTLAALTVAWVMPPVYTARATILVESQQIPSELARSTVTASAAERLQVIEQRLMTRETLLAVSRELGLFADRPEMTPTDRVEAMREATAIEPIILQQDRRNTTVTAFTIAYTAHRAGLAAGVANEFVTRVLEQNLKQRSDRAAETNAFFKAELERLQAELGSTAEEIAQFKTENEAALPDSLEFRRGEMAAIQERLFVRAQRRVELEEERRTLEEQLAEGLAIAGNDLTPEERELEQLRRTLTQQQAILASTHPTIRSLKARIDALEGVVQPAAARGEDVAETARSAAERRVERRLELIGTQLDFLARQDENDTARIAALEASIARTPAVEMSLAGLERRYNDLKQQRDVAVVKQAEAATGERLEVNRQAERFEVIEQAEPPVEPDAPNRPLIAAGGAAASLGLGLGLALMLTMADRTIRTPGDLERRLELRPVITVPYISTEAEARRRTRRRLLVGAAVLLGLPLALGLIDQFVMPLPLLAERIVTKTGFDDLLWALGQRTGL